MINLTKVQNAYKLFHLLFLNRQLKILPLAIKTITPIAILPVCFCFPLFPGILRQVPSAL